MNGTSCTRVCQENFDLRSQAQPAPSSSVLVDNDVDVGGWGALHLAVLNLHAAIGHRRYLQESSSIGECTYGFLMCCRPLHKCCKQPTDQKMGPALHRSSACLAREERCRPC